MTAFPELPVTTDPRINTNLRICLKCEDKLRPVVGVERTGKHEARVWGGICDRCGTVYIMGELEQEE